MGNLTFVQFSHFLALSFVLEEPIGALTLPSAVEFSLAVAGLRGPFTTFNYTNILVMLRWINGFIVSVLDYHGFTHVFVIANLRLDWALLYVCIRFQQLPIGVCCGKELFQSLVHDKVVWDWIIATR